MVQSSSIASRDALPRGATIGRYVIVDILGSGGMGVVYAAYDLQLDRKVAIKVLRPDIVRGANAPEIEARLLREAQALARLTHPNVVAVHDVGTHDRLVFIAMDFVEGLTLKEWLETPRPLRERLRVMRDAGRGLAAAHAAGLVHRDFKPDNVLVGTGGRVVVLDFGLARAEGDTSPETPSAPRLADADAIAGRGSDPLGSPLTLTGSILGTVGYMAPEQAFGRAASAATDQFSYAATLYVALYGRKPFPDPTLDGYLTQAEGPVPEPKSQSRVPPWLRRIALRGLSADPKKRFPSMDAMLAALEKDPRVVRRRTALVAAAVIALGVGVVAGGAALRQREQICAADPAELAGVWDEDARAAMTQAFEKSSGAAARERAPRVAKKLDDFAARWSDMRADACRATRVRKDQPEDVLRLRNDCLDRERTQVRSLTTVLAHADAQVVKKAIEIAYGLPQLAWCADVATLRASAGLPDDPAARAQVLQVRAKLADVEAADFAGRAKEAEAGAAEAVTLARAIDHAPTTAEALLASGRQLQRLGDYAGALPPLREATFLAIGSGADSIAVNAARLSAFVTGAKLRRSEEARIWLDIARAALKRSGGNEELELGILATEAFILEDGESRPELAVPILEQVVAADRRLYGPHPNTIIALYNVGDALCNVGEPARARPYVEEGVAMADLVGGPSYMFGAGSAYVLGQVLVDQGESERGRPPGRARSRCSSRTGWTTGRRWPSSGSRRRRSRGDRESSPPSAASARSSSSPRPGDPVSSFPSSV